MTILILLRRAQTIKAARIARRSRIAEIDRRIADGDSGQRGPDGVDQIGAGFYHNDIIGGAADVKAELIGAQGWTGGLGIP